MAAAQADRVFGGQGEDAPGSIPRILLVGAGCTGALTAALLRRGLVKTGNAHRLAVWEWGRGPAGRMSSFWTEVGGERILADVGAQVISLRDGANLPEWVKPFVVDASPLGLATTDERQHTWHHFHAPAGMSSIQRASLDDAQPDELHYNRRLLELMPGSSRRWRAGYSGQRGGRRPAGHEEFDIVVFAGTAADAGGNEGIRNALASEQQQALRAVRYDHRVCMALVLKQDMVVPLEKLCNGNAETVPDDDDISLVARQDVKGRNHAVARACAVTLHGTLAFAKRNEQLARQQKKPPTLTGSQQLLQSFANLLHIPSAHLRSSVLDSKVVHWRQCQVNRPLVGNAVSDGCLVAAKDPSLILAGDYLAGAELAGSFEGCFVSARAAAANVTSTLNGDVSATSRGLQGRLSRRGTPQYTADDTGGQASSERRTRWSQGSAYGPGGEADIAKGSQTAGRRRWQRAAS